MMISQKFSYIKRDEELQIVTILSCVRDRITTTSLCLRVIHLKNKGSPANGGKCLQNQTKRPKIFFFFLLFYIGVLLR